MYIFNHCKYVYIYIMYKSIHIYIYYIYTYILYIYIHILYMYILYTIYICIYYILYIYVYTIYYIYISLYLYIIYKKNTYIYIYIRVHLYRYIISIYHTHTWKHEAFPRKSGLSASSISRYLWPIKRRVTCRAKASNMARLSPRRPRHGSTRALGIPGNPWESGDTPGNFTWKIPLENLQRKTSGKLTSDSLRLNFLWLCSRNELHLVGFSMIRSVHQRVFMTFSGILWILMAVYCIYLTGTYHNEHW